MTVRAATPIRASAVGAATRLVGREAELSAICSFVDSLMGEGGVLVFAGDAGVGKSALLDAAAGLARDAGMRVVRTTGVEFRPMVSFAALHDILMPVRDHFDRLSPSYRDALTVALGLAEGRVRDPLLLSNAALEVFRSRGPGRPTLLVIDDLQWLDPASAEVIALMSRRLTSTSVGVIAASLPGDRGPFATGGLPQTPLSPLDDDAAAELVGRHFPALADRVVRRVLAEAQGNPLALVELPSRLSLYQQSAAEPLPEILPLPQRLAAMFVSRLAALPPQCRGLILRAALEGSGDLRRLVESTSTPGVWDALAPAEKLDLVAIEDARRRLVFRHPLARAAVVEAASPDERRRAHLEIARAWSLTPDRRAWHLAEATEGVDEEVAGLLEDVGRASLRRGDSVGAVRALARAADLSPQRSDRGRRLVDAAYIGAAVTGQLASAAHMLEAARESEPGVAASLRATVAASNLLLNAECDIDSAHRLLVGAILRHGDRYDAEDETLVDALHSLFMVCWYGSRPDLWGAFDDALRRIEPQPPDLLALSASTFGDPVHQAPALLARLDAAIAAAREDFDPVRITRIGIASIYTDRVSACREALWRVITDGRAGGAVALSISALVSSCVDDWLTGQWDEALRLAAEGAELSRANGYRRFSRILEGYIRPLILVVRGQAGEGLALADDMAEWGATRGVGMATTFALHVQTLSAIGSGDFEVAYQRACAVSPAGVLARYTPHALWMLLDVVESAERTGRHEHAVAHVAAMMRADVASVSPRLRLMSLGSAALVASDDDAGGLFERALAVDGGRRSPFERARIALWYGEYLRRQQLLSSSKEHLSAAREAFEQLGALPWVDRASAALRAVGAPSPRLHRSGVGLLTPEELEIAALAASGLTNKQIAGQLYLSHRTVGARLYRIFPKLGVTSRAALRDALSQSGGEA
jgi:DNA-binding CsgD family transcriptional regulator